LKESPRAAKERPSVKSSLRERVHIGPDEGALSRKIEEGKENAQELGIPPNNAKTKWRWMTVRESNLLNIFIPTPTFFRIFPMALSESCAYEATIPAHK
jgi:hypothetical protein